MSDFKKVLAETKARLKNLITKETKQEDITAISDIDKQLDSLDEAFTEKEKENESLKDNLIASIKSTGFKVNGSSQENQDIDGNEKSMDEIISEELNKVLANKK